MKKKKKRKEEKSRCQAVIWVSLSYLDGFMGIGVCGGYFNRAAR